ARSRRGYGSLSLASLTVSGEGRAVPATPGELDHALARFHEEADDRLPEYTAFSGQSRHLVLRCGRTSATEVLNLLGIEYAAYRRGSGHASKRIPFGLPLKVSREKKPAVPDGYTRRASPLMFHIHQCEEEAVAV